MERFKHGDEVWGRREDGSWARWNRATMLWEDRDDPPPPDELEVLEVPDPEIFLGSGARRVDRPSGAALQRRRVLLFAAAMGAAILITLFFAWLGKR